MNKHCIRMSIVALAAAAFGLASVAGPAQALADSGTTLSTTISVKAPGDTTAIATVTVAPDDSCWD